MIRTTTATNTRASAFNKTTVGQRLRVFQRAKISGQVFIHDEERLYIAPLDNISAGGVFIDKLVSIPTGRYVRVVIKSSSLPQPVQAKGIVVRVDSHARGLAVEFTSISSRAREMIQNCVFDSRMEGALKNA